MNAHPDTQALRQMVREVLREMLPAGFDAAASAATEPAPERVESVSLSNDAELADFVQRLLALCEDRGAREALRGGRFRFRLRNGRGVGTPQAGGASAADQRDDAMQRFERGVLSEAKVVKFAQSTQRIIVNRRVVVTPLARDKARQLGVKLERVK